MVYVDNGQLHKNQPWSFSKFFQLLDGFLMFFILFFKTLFGLDTSKSTKTSSGGLGRGSGGGGGGWGPGSGRPNGPGGGRPRFRTMGDLNQPTVYGGGCPGGSCGL